MLSCQTLKRGLIFGLLATAPTVEASQDPTCRCFPGDECWPSVSTWNALNQSIDGRLIKTVPLATPCHTPNYDEDKCETLRNGWNKTNEQYVLLFVFWIPTLTLLQLRVVFLCHGTILYKRDL